MNKLFILALLSMSNFPAQGMVRANGKISVDQDTMLIGGVVVAGTALAYLLYRSNYKSSLKEAHDSLNQSQNSVQQLVTDYNKDILANVHCSTDAQPIYEQIKRDTAELQKILSATQKHAAAWKGYTDYRHGEAQAVIKQVSDLRAQFVTLKVDLDHRVAIFALNDDVISQIASKYPQDYNPLAHISDLAQARAYQRQLHEDIQVLENITQALKSYLTNWAKHKDNQVEKARTILQNCDFHWGRLATISQNLKYMIAEYELEECYNQTESRLRSWLNLMQNPEKLSQIINKDYFKEAYPLLTSVKQIETYMNNLRAKALPIHAGNTVKHHSIALANELQELIGVIANMPQYDEQKISQRADSREKEKRLAEERRLREERELKERLAREDRETKERIARQEREAKERHDKAMLEEQRRIARAAEEKAQAERERVRLERERLLLETLRQNNQKENVNIHIHNPR